MCGFSGSSLFCYRRVGVVCFNKKRGPIFLVPEIFVNLQRKRKIMSTKISPINVLIAGIAIFVLAMSVQEGQNGEENKFAELAAGWNGELPHQQPHNPASNDQGDRYHPNGVA